MLALNLAALESPNSPYMKLLEEANTSKSKKAHRFIIKEFSPEVVKAAADTINSLLVDNPQLLLVSESSTPEKLKQKIASCRYLVINGNAICLTDKTKAPEGVDIVCTDFFFSEAFIDQPVQCVQGHSFEKEHIEGWVRGKGNICPHESRGQHEIGQITPDDSLEIDEYLLNRIKSVIASYEEQELRHKTITAQVQRDEATAAIQNARINARISAIQSAIKPDRTVEMSGTVCKVVFKAGTLIALKTTCEVGKCGLHAAAKKLPVICLFIGVILAAYRCRQAYTTGDNTQYAKAALEIASGVAACFPGYGTVGSIAIDGVIGGWDIYEINNGNVQVNISLQNAHNILELDPSQQVTKEQIDKALGKISKFTHTDLVAHGRIYTQEEFNNIQVLVGQAKDLLYQHYGFREAA